ncbi:hypothetical protein D9M70_613800 [compost metagenome]
MCGGISRSIRTSKMPISPSTAAAAVVRRRWMIPDGDRNSTSRTSGPASLFTRGALRGPTPFRVETSANRGKRISGRISLSIAGENGTGTLSDPTHHMNGPGKEPRGRY